MKYLLDTNILIRYSKRDEDVRRRFHEKQPDDYFVCSVVKSELFYGAEKSANPKRSRTESDHILSQFESLPFDDQAAHEFGKIRAYLELKGKIIGSYDMQIAAIALANDLTLITKNHEEFDRIPGLRVERW